MARLRRFLQSVASGYALLFAAMLSTLGSVPLALHYLTKEQFGLWALIVQFAGYMEMMDLGMSGSVARYLVDHKDRPHEGRYGSLIQTGACVLAMQGLVILSIGVLLAPFLGRLLGIPNAVRSDFILLCRWQCAILAFQFLTRIFHHILYAHQRNDVTNYSQIALFLFNFLVLWGALAAGCGVLSIIWSNALGAVVLAVIAFWGCTRLGLLPSGNGWGRPRWSVFQELFRFGRDVVLVALGNQLILASQNVIITRALGLNTVALWSVGTKAFNLICQLLWRIFDFSEPAFMEMIVRNEQERLRHRFKSIVMVTTAVGGVAAAGLALGNGAFVSVWTNGRLVWPSAYDLWLAVWLMILILGHCHCGFVLATKKIGRMGYVYLAEGGVFVVLAGLTTRAGGLGTMVLLSITCTACFSLASGLRHTARFFRFPLREVILDWQYPLLREWAVLAPAAIGVGWCCRGFTELLRLSVAAALVGTLGTYALWRFGLPRDLQEELRQRLPMPMRRMLGRACR